jgi:hypothetical protein
VSPVLNCKPKQLFTFLPHIGYLGLGIAKFYSCELECFLAQTQCTQGTLNNWLHLLNREDKIEKKIPITTLEFNTFAPISPNLNGKVRFQTI